MSGTGTQISTSTLELGYAKKIYLSYCLCYVYLELTKDFVCLSQCVIPPTHITRKKTKNKIKHTGFGVTCKGTQLWNS